MVEHFWKIWPWILAIVDLLAATAVTIHAVLWKRDARSVIAWVGLAWLAPLLGSLAYVALGINRIERRAVALRVRRRRNRRHLFPFARKTATVPGSTSGPPDTSGTSDSVPCGPQASADARGSSPEFEQLHAAFTGLARLGRQLTSRDLLPGNRVVALRDGDEAYPAMLRALDGAQRSIALASYIFDSDRVGSRFREALVRARRRGVLVRVLVDDVGAHYSRPNMVRLLQQDDVPTAAFLPVRLPRISRYTNLRNHRKLLVVDGKIGFTGGTNIREGHQLNLQPSSPVQCLHFQLEGPVVGHLQETFAVDWEFTTGESLRGSAWFPDLECVGPVWARGIASGPDEDFETLNDTLLGALSVARESVRIVCPYFVPSMPLIHALTVTAMRGVDVEITIPERTNIPFVAWAALGQAGQYLRKGCRVLLSPTPFDHTKLMVVDRQWVLIGSTNWDARSLRLNFEFNVECYDRDLASQLHEVAGEKMRHARELTWDELQRQSLALRLRNGLSRLLTPYL